MPTSLDPHDIQALVTRVYRADAARLLAVLTRIFGPHNLDLAEDVLQEAFSKAMVHWQREVPQNPTGWIMATARNSAIDAIRSLRTRVTFADDLSHHLESEWTLRYTVEQAFEETRIRDDLLRMIFMCCGDDLRPANRLPLILKTLCGFSVLAISRALLLPEATVKKRLLRARERLSAKHFAFPPKERLPPRMDTVHTVIYLLFNEGFHSSDGQRAVREELCAEAMRLLHLLMDEPRVVNRDTMGLLALMHFHTGRLSARTDKDGAPIPLDLQDRARWDRDRFERAQRILDFGDGIPPGASGRFVLEAQIAREHCAAPTFAQTDWPRIVELYGALEALTGSPVVSLNKAVAIGYAGDVEGAIAEASRLRDLEALRATHAPDAILAHLHAMAGHPELAHRFAGRSMQKGGAPHEHRLLVAQVERLLSRHTA